MNNQYFLSDIMWQYAVPTSFPLRKETQQRMVLRLLKNNTTVKRFN